jgi:hypothetical protein
VRARHARGARRAARAARCHGQAEALCGGTVLRLGTPSAISPTDSVDVGRELASPAVTTLLALNRTTAPAPLRYVNASKDDGGSARDKCAERVS